MIRFKHKKATGSKKYPLMVQTTFRTYVLPQQKEFGDFSKKHGCSLAAICVALQHIGIKKDPDDIYEWANKNLVHKTNSKITIYGCEQAINGISGTTKARWYPLTGTKNNYRDALRRCRRALRKNAVILMEQRSPIHTNLILCRRRTGAGVWVATNGKVKKDSCPNLLKKSLKGVSGRSSQDNWYHSGRSSRAAGYVIVNK